MLLTEEEAKTRWCHASRVIAGTRSAATKATLSLSGAVFNRIELGPSTVAVPDGAACLGSGCMAWRWLMEPMGDPFDASKPAPIARPVPPTHGWCGLAGRPG